MKFPLAVSIVSLVFVATSAVARTAVRDYPSCDLGAQHALKGETGGAIKDVGQEHIGMRANMLQADLASARRARHLTRAQAEGLFKRVGAIRASADRAVSRRGFLSAAARVGHDRELDAVAKRVCNI